jgi:(R)-2-hydroxyacyl-CoA dehydratese activating ATPase
MDYYAGIDAGSTYIKVVVLDETGRMVGREHRPTGINADKSAREMIAAIAADNGIMVEDIKHIIATGYSRRGLSNAHDTVTEIKAHARGAGWSAGNGAGVRTVIDIGGQDSKVIVINDNGTVDNFVMNDKCAAGTGRFLESLARVLELGVDQLGPLSLESTQPTDINSTCVVFAESEVISLVARRKPRQDIIAGIHYSLAKRVAAMARKARFSETVMLTGGGGLNPGLAQALEDELMADVLVPELPQFNGAVGAAMIAGGLTA